MSVNKVILVGNLGADPETRYSASGLAITNIRLATNEVRKNRQTGERETLTEWHRIVFFERLAEIAAQYLRKGSQVYVEGRIRTNKWQDQSGMDRYTTEIIANEMKMLGARGDADHYSPPAGGYEQPAPPPVNTPSMNTYQQQSPAAPTPAAPPAASTSAPPPSADFDDDIPF